MPKYTFPEVELTLEKCLDQYQLIYHIQSVGISRVLSKEEQEKLFNAGKGLTFPFEVYVCTCPLAELMSQGCTCGQMERERAKKLDATV